MEVATDPNFSAAYTSLEKRMEELADADGDVFLPNPTPKGLVDFVFICMEPSLGSWAQTKDKAKAKVRAGFKNFLFSLEDFILHFCARRYLCGGRERYHITDLSKGAMLVEHADVDRVERYDRWYALLEEELDLVARPGAEIVTVGRVVGEHLERRNFPRPFTQVLHYSSQAASARKVFVAGREHEFESFKDTVSLPDVLDNAETVLRDAGVPEEERAKMLSRLSNSKKLSESRRKLIFCYKTMFESIREGRG